MKTHVVARDLKEGDRIITTGPTGVPSMACVVVAIVPSVQVVRRKVLLLTLQDDKGRTFHRQYNEFSSIPCNS